MRVYVMAIIGILLHNISQSLEPNNEQDYDSIQMLESLNLEVMEYLDLDKSDENPLHENLAIRQYPTSISHDSMPLAVEQLANWCNETVIHQDFSNHIYRQYCSAKPVNIRACVNVMHRQNIPPQMIQSPDMMLGVIGAAIMQENSADTLRQAVMCAQQWQAQRRDKQSLNYVTSAEAHHAITQEYLTLQAIKPRDTQQQKRLELLADMLQKDDNYQRIFYLNDETIRFINSQTFSWLEEYMRAQEHPLYVDGSLKTIFKMQAGMVPKINLEYFTPQEMAEIIAQSNLTDTALVTHLLRKAEAKAQSVGKAFNKRQALLEIGNHLMSHGNIQDLKFGLFVHKEVTEAQSYDDNLLNRFLYNRNDEHFSLEEIYNNKPISTDRLHRMYYIGKIKTKAELDARLVQAAKEQEEYDRLLMEAQDTAITEVREISRQILGYGITQITVQKELDEGVAGGYIRNMPIYNPNGPSRGSITLYDPFTEQFIARLYGKQKADEIVLTAKKGLSKINHELYGHASQIADGNILWSYNLNAQGDFCINMTDGLCFDQTMTNINMYHYLPYNKLTAIFAGDGNVKNYLRYQKQPAEHPAWIIESE